MPYKLINRDTSTEIAETYNLDNALEDLQERTKIAANAIRNGATPGPVRMYLYDDENAAVSILITIRGHE